MIAAALRRHTLAFAAVALFSGGAMADGLESVSSVETAALPSMPAQIANPGLIAIDGRAVAFEPTHLWVLDVDRRAWASMDAALPASHAIVRAAASDGDVAVLLLGDVETDVVTRAATVGFAGDGLTMRELPQLPFALSSAFGATRGRALFVAGIDAENTPRLLQLSVTSDAGEWIEHAGWPGDAVPVSLIFQNSAVYLLAQSPGEPTQQMLRWSGKGGWQPMDPPPTPIVRGSGRAIGQSARSLHGERE